jgi:hypothetical protein
MTEKDNIKDTSIMKEASLLGVADFTFWALYY